MYYSYVTGEPFKGEFPQTIEYTTGELVNDIYVVSGGTANKGDAGYNEQLERYMFERGYLDYASAPEWARLKGGEGSGNYGHAGRPGEIGGSAPSATETENFKKWFGNSQVVNEDGSPKIVYHGTSGEFTTFNPGKPNNKMELGFGIHFAEDASFAGDYYAVNPGKPGDEPKPIVGGNVIPVYLKIERMLKADAVYEPGTPEYALAKKLGRNKVPKMGVYMQRALDMTTPERAERIIREAGYDGIQYKAETLSGLQGFPGHWTRIVSGSSISYVVFEPTQIKSAIGNSGEFDPSNPDATKERVRKLPGKYVKYSAKGGEGSGNYGHAGRPGEIGGSAPTLQATEYAPGKSSITNKNVRDFLKSYIKYKYPSKKVQNVTLYQSSVFGYNATIFTDPGLFDDTEIRDIHQAMTQASNGVWGVELVRRNDLGSLGKEADSIVVSAKHKGDAIEYFKYH